ncbi:MAG: glycosyltransferase family 1 protein [Cyanobacteriota bacterium]|nr:glycosyltransferase family 1 protein [Cyanobacteriota bacterium]
MSAEPRPSRRKRVFFYRDYQRFQGGHLKVWNYFQHVAASGTHEPRIHLSANSRMESDNPWSDIPEEWRLRSWNPEAADVLFLAGLDWQQVPLSNQTPTINLIQHVRHGDQGDPRCAYLGRPALRICVSDEIREAILSTGLVNGPVVTIPNGLDLPQLDHNRHKQEDRILIIGMKNPGFATALAWHLNALGIDSDLVTEALPRSLFLETMARFQVVITLPQEREGFYLPALEAMALNSIVICPDCEGNRDFCLDGINAFRPSYRMEAVVQATLTARGLTPGQKKALLMEGQKTALQHSLFKEREAFLPLLRGLGRGWDPMIKPSGAEAPS